MTSIDYLSFLPYYMIYERFYEVQEEKVGIINEDEFKAIVEDETKFPKVMADLANEIEF